MSNTAVIDEFDSQAIALAISKKSGQITIGAAVHKRRNRTGMDDEILYSIELFDFFDNDQFSNLDAFLVQMGSCILYISEEFENSFTGDGKKVANICDGKDVERVFVKKSFWGKKAEAESAISKLSGKQTHVTNVAETERPLGYRYSFPTTCLRYDLC